MTEQSQVAVIFESVRNGYDDEGYERMSDQMLDLVHQQAGFEGVTSVRDSQTGRGITVSYWANEDSAVAWKNVAEHLQAQHLGATKWYDAYEVIVTRVVRRYAGR
jgi:heme-degrading monooxygenase HmoA